LATSSCPGGRNVSLRWRMGDWCSSRSRSSRGPASGARARVCPCARSSVTGLWRWPRSKGRKPTCE
jgi:hypothetical protein